VFRLVDLQRHFSTRRSAHVMTLGSIVGCVAGRKAGGATGRVNEVDGVRSPW